MHNLPSHGRILFEVLCALGVAASFAGGWMQTGAWAFLPAAAVAALYALVHAFDLAGHSPAAIGADSALELKAKDRLPEDLERASVIQDVELVEPEGLPAKKARKSKTPRKPRARRAAEDRKVAEPVPFQEEEVTLVGVPENEGVAMFPDEVVHIPLAPLFEPEPFVRQQRAVFGRKAG